MLFNLGRFSCDDYIKWSSALIRMDFLLVAFFSQEHKINNCHSFILSQFTNKRGY